MEYEEFAQILNRHIFVGDKKALLINIAESPERYIGLFRPTKPKAKLLQNLLQSHEIRFGDAMEELIKGLIHELGYRLLPERIRDAEGNDLSIDIYFTDDQKYYFVEQKVRDDHDSAKKRGQIRNFEVKLDFLHRLHGDQLAGCMYFIDPELVKNKIYYADELRKFSAFYSVELHLFYGAEFFSYLGHLDTWQNLLDWLTLWKESLPEIPEINFDLSPQESFDEIKNLSNRYWRRIIQNDRLWRSGIMQVLFRDGGTLMLLLNYFYGQSQAPYPSLTDGLVEKLTTYYPSLQLKERR